MIDGIACTLIDNGMPLVVMDAAAFGLSGHETREALDTNLDLKAKLEAIRLIAGPLMNLGDVADKSVPKMTLVSKSDTAAISTRSFIPHRCHATIGVFAAVTVATACTLSDGPANRLATLPLGNTFAIAHPTGAVDVVLERDASGAVLAAGTLRTARKLFDGLVFPAPL